MTEQNEIEQIDENELIAQRKAKLVELRAKGQAYPNDFRRDSLAQEIHQQFNDQDNEELQSKKHKVKVAGRIMLRRIMGKASFIQLQDMSGHIQLYLRKNDLPEGVYAEFKKWDLGDIVGVEGFVFKTKTGELSIHAEQIQLLTKSLRPLPDKFHGLADMEMRYRQRYIDLIANPESMEVFRARIKIIDGIRNFLKQRQYLEVETPMMQVMPGGAAARPFVTHHNALDMPLYLRIAPELYLKRLVVGGFERVFEINRNFRNEGLSVQHNPEFTMLEFYQAYADYNDLIDLTEAMFKELAQEIFGTTKIKYQGNEFDFSKPFAKMSVKESILHFNKDITAAEIDDLAKAKKIAKKLEIPLHENYQLGRIQMQIFEKTVEDKLIQPTFITEYPAEVSPLARRNDDNPLITDRFELIIGGMEIANGFSELNDAEDQAERFRKQVAEKAAGDEEAMPYDEDYITALDYGLPPTAGEGIGVDRLVMLFTDSASIRDVILFPHMKCLK
jgi:lysyl-tRNA synthetase, class II